MINQKRFHDAIVRNGLLLLLILQTVSCVGPQPGNFHHIPEPGSKPSINLSNLEKQIHENINRERQKHGLPLLRWNDALSRIARKHSNDMARRNYFSHRSPDGRDFLYRYRQAGYSCAVQVNERMYTGAENIFQNNLYDRVVFVDGAAHFDWNTSRKIAESTVHGWMNSPGHRKNILMPHWKSEGIGVAVSPDDKVYITQNFC